MGRADLTAPYIGSPSTMARPEDAESPAQRKSPRRYAPPALASAATGRPVKIGIAETLRSFPERVGAAPRGRAVCPVLFRCCGLKVSHRIGDEQTRADQSVTTKFVCCRHPCPPVPCELTGSPRQSSPGLMAPIAENAAMNSGASTIPHATSPFALSRCFTIPTRQTLLHSSELPPIGTRASR
jgi:hypothetical protein